MTAQTAPEPAISRAGDSQASGRFLPVSSIADWLPADLASRLLEYAVTNEARFRTGTVLHEGSLTVDAAYRVSSVLPDLGEFEAPLRTAAMAIKPELEKAFGVPSFPVARFEMELAAHGDGAHFQRHVDTFVVVNRSASTRVLTLVLYLNRTPKRFSGGAIRIYALGESGHKAPGENGHKDLEPAHNLLVAFPSIAPHSVERVSCPSREFAACRFAVNIWIHR